MISPFDCRKPKGSMDSLFCQILKKCGISVDFFRFCDQKSVKELSGEHYKKKFSTNQQFSTCLYAQMTGKDSLREIERGLIANHNRLYHLGMSAAAKSTLADAMNRRNPDMFKGLEGLACL